MSHANPLLQPWSGEFGLPPFAQVQPAHFPPAFEVAMSEHLRELQAIADEPQAPSFDNTVAAFDRSGRLYTRLAQLLGNLGASHTSPALQEVEMALAAPMAAHDSRVYMHAGLFKRLDEVHARRASLGLSAEQLRLVERVHLDFVLAGARLQGAARERYAQIGERKAELTTRFAQNVLHDESEFRLVLRTEEELAGLPEFVRDTARQAATERGLPTGDHVITLSRSLVVPFLTFSTRRDLREQAWRAWTGRGEHAGEHDNREVARDILRLRREQAALHGHATFADYALVDTMAGRPHAVQGLLRNVWPRALAAVQREREALLQAQRDAGDHTPLQAWDWRYWAEKVRQQRYAIDDAEVKPYFPLPQVAQAAFDCAQRLFGLQFVPRPDVASYHPDVNTYEVRDAAGRVVALFMQDNFARPSKRSGAWMSNLRHQNRNEPGGGGTIPIVLNNNNFAKGAPGQPTLLSLDDARTLFHEFGHGLHGMLSNVTFDRLSCTQVLQDFVELPSQIFEHWLEEPQVLKRHARHWQTGEPIPDDLVARLKRAQRFNQGYETARYAASALVDMAVHSLPEAEPPADLCAFERGVLAGLGLPDEVGINHRLVHFQHLFSGDDYAAGYYVYIWAEVLDADGYEAFVEKGDPFHPEVAQALKQYIYSSGNSLEPGAAYLAFRGRAPQVEPMLRQRGLIEEGEPA